MERGESHYNLSRGGSHYNLSHDGIHYDLSRVEAITIGQAHIQKIRKFYQALQADFS